MRSSGTRPPPRGCVTLVQVRNATQQHDHCKESRHMSIVAVIALPIVCCCAHICRVEWPSFLPGHIHCTRLLQAFDVSCKHDTLVETNYMHAYAPCCVWCHNRRPDIMPHACAVLNPKLFLQVSVVQYFRELTCMWKQLEL